jgi:hypothetical protein
MAQRDRYILEHRDANGKLVSPDSQSEEYKFMNQLPFDVRSASEDDLCRGWFKHHPEAQTGIAWLEIIPWYKSHGVSIRKITWR